MVLVLLEVVEEETAVKHDWVMLLSNLVGLGKVSVHIVLSVKLNLRQDATTKSQRGFDGEVQALFIEDGQHSWQTKVHKVSVSVGLLAVGAQ